MEIDETVASSVALCEPQLEYAGGSVPLWLKLPSRFKPPWVGSLSL